MRLALAQINSVVGDLEGNRDRVLARLDEAKEAGADLVLFPELVVTGYPPEDLLLRPSFVRAAERTLGEIAVATRGLVALVGAADEVVDVVVLGVEVAAGERVGPPRRERPHQARRELGRRPRRVGGERGSHVRLDEAR